MYGIHDIRFWNIETGMPYAHLKILGEASYAMNPEMAELAGGSQKAPWDVAIKSITSEFKATAKEYDPVASKILTAGNLREYSANAQGEVIDARTMRGLSILNSQSGIASITVKASKNANLKEGYYILKATDATHVQLYAYSDVDFGQGATKLSLDDAGRLLERDIAVPEAGGVVDIDDFGISITGGSGTITLTPGDTARFYVVRPHGGAWHLDLGSSASDFEEVGVTVASAKVNGMVTMLHLWRCKAAGLSFVFPENDYGTYEINVKPMYDPVMDGFGQFIRTFKGAA
jgi:hypothetical protein